MHTIMYILCAFVDLIIQKHKIGQEMQGTNNLKIITVQQARVEL